MIPDTVGMNQHRAWGVDAVVVGSRERVAPLLRSFEPESVGCSLS
jgi:hypothetical protein